MKRISSRENPQYRLLLKLASSSRARRSTGATILEGEHLVEAYGSGGATAEILAAGESAYAKPHIRALIERSPAKMRLLLDDRLLARISLVVSATGLVAVVKTPSPGPVPETLGNCLLLESIQDPGNLGSLLRSAAAAGVRQVFLSPGSVFAWAPKVVRSGQGAHFFLSIHEGVLLPGIARRVQGKVIATDPRAELDLFHADLRGTVAWLFGNEGAGLSSEAAAAAHLRLRIPMPGRAESLNVAAAAAICLFEQARQQAAVNTRGVPA